MIEEKYQYYAFISYKREDEEWAKWLQHKLEYYKLPTNLHGRTDIPEKIRPIFKDTLELMPGNLPEQIRLALELSKYLIVICSPSSAQSEWVNKEVETFFSMQRTTSVIPFIIEGKAFADTPEEECFPPVLRQLPEEQEILGTNINEMGRDAAVVKVVARMFDIQFDELWHRHEREQRRRHRMILSTVAVFIITVLSVAGWIWHQNQELKLKNYKIMVGQSRYVAGTASRLADNGETYLARLLALEVLLNNPYTPEAEAALRKACQGNSTILSEYIEPLTAIYSPQGKWVAAVDQVTDSIYLWDSNSGKLMFVIDAKGSVDNLAFNASEDVVQATYDNGNIKQWKVPEGTVNEKKVPVISRKFMIPELSSPSYSAMAAVYSPDSSMLAVAYREGVTRLYDTATRQCIQTFDDEDLVVWNVDFCPDGKRLLIAANHCVRICDIAGQLPFKYLYHCASPAWSYVFSSNYKYLLSVHTCGIICCWDLDNEQFLWEFNEENFYNIQQTKIEFGKKDTEIKIFYADGSRFILSSTDGSQKYFSKGTISVKDDEEELETETLSSVETLSPDGKTRAAVKDDRNVVIYKADSNEEICLLHKDCQNDIHAEVVSIAFSDDNRYIVIGLMNGSVWVYEFPPLQELIESNLERFRNRQLTSDERKKFYLE